MDICFRCGLPKEACVCSELEKEKQKIRITAVERKFGKKVTIIEGISQDIKKIAKKLKEELACGGTIKDNRIELQGDHEKKVKEKLKELGFENIE
ncbi:MAG: stress response translation initiation inhibitor YciH [Candidatus Pacearchaeota archaeon]|nr:stress response translation initiation inhibitor YciH [Candidatus Pacearchaeota archaeon]